MERQTGSDRRQHEVLLLASERFTAHATPVGHPERPERATVMADVARQWANAGGAVAVPEPVTTAALLRVHDQQHIETIASTSGRLVRLDPDTYASPESDAVARLAAGAAVTAIDHVVDGGGRALAFVRPPGHHAERDRAMGFCLYNNIAVAAAHALTRGLDKVAIVDYDVHHGNGTQWMFYDDPRVLYISLHQYPFYPGTGAVDDVGRGSGAGFTVNVPLEAGAGDADYDLVFRTAVLPILEAFRPDALLLSAGYDAHDRDPLGGMHLSTAGVHLHDTGAASDGGGLLRGANGGGHGGRVRSAGARSLPDGDAGGHAGFPRDLDRPARWLHCTRRGRPQTGSTGARRLLAYVIIQGLRWICARL